MERSILQYFLRNFIVIACIFVKYLAPEYMKQTLGPFYVWVEVCFHSMVTASKGKTLCKKRGLSRNKLKCWKFFKCFSNYEITFFDTGHISQKLFPVFILVFTKKTSVHEHKVKCEFKTCHYFFNYLIHLVNLLKK